MPARIDLSESKDRIIELYLKGIRAEEIGEEFGINSSTVRYRLKEWNVPYTKSMMKRRKRIDLPKEKVIALYSEMKSVCKVGEVFGVAGTTIIKRLKEWGIETGNTKRRIDLPKDKVIALYLKGEPVTGIGKLFGASKQVIQRRLEEWGITNRRLPLPPKEELIDLYLKGYDCGEIGEMFNVSRQRILGHFRKWGVKFRIEGGKSKTKRFLKEHENEIIELYQNYVATRIIGEKYNVSASAIRNLLRRNNIELRKATYFTRLPEDITSKRCTKCGKIKPLEDFLEDNRKTSIVGRTAVCKECTHKLLKTIRCKELGISYEDFLGMITSQRNLCAICDLPETIQTRDGDTSLLSIDHDHKSGKVRGLLCRNCNTGAGCFDESISRMKAAIEYLHTMDIVSNRPFWEFTLKEGYERKLVSPTGKKQYFLHEMKERHFAYLLEITNNKCMVCGRYRLQGNAKRLNIDHDHSMEGILSVRGLLCNWCNVGLRRFTEDPGVIGKAIQYLEKHKEISNATND